MGSHSQIRKEIYTMTKFEALREKYLKGFITLKEGWQIIQQHWAMGEEIFTPEEEAVYNEGLSWGFASPYEMLEKGTEQFAKEIDELAKEAYEEWEAQDRYDRCWGFDKVVYEASAVL
jgi:hypothetical protein